MPDPSQFPETRLSYQETLDQLSEWVKAEIPIRLDHKKHLVGHYDQAGGAVFELRLPSPMPTILPEEPSLASYLDRVKEEIPSYVLMLVQVGAAALGYFEEGEVVYHKAFKKYMKRQKRGKAQISYLNTRGKSKAGSRIRLANTVRFFEELNERLTEWEEDLEPERIIYSITPQLWGLMFSSDPAPPFEKKDPRLIKVAAHVHVPDHAEMMRINNFILQGRLTHYQDQP